MPQTPEAAIEQAHSELAPDVRDVPWTSNCAGEIFIADGSDTGMRIGHFQGDAKLAAFAVLAHNAMLARHA